MRQVGRTAAFALAVSFAVLGRASPQAAAADKVYTFLAVTKTNGLIRFKSDAPGTILARVQIPGGHATATEVWALAVRRSTRQLYSFGQTFRLTRIDPATGQIVWQGPNVASIDTPLLYGGRVAMDFEPGTELVRLQFPSGMTIRLDPDSGAAIDADASKAGVQPDHDRLLFVAGDPRAAQGDVAAIGIAYDRSQTGTPAYTIHGRNGTALVRIDSYGAPRSSDAVARTVGEMGIGGGTGDVLDLLEIADDGAAWLVTQRINRAGAYLARVDLTTGTFSPSEIWPSAPDTGTDILTDENIRAFCLDPDSLAPPPSSVPPVPPGDPLPPKNPVPPPGPVPLPPPVPPDRDDPPFGAPPAIAGVVLSADRTTTGNDTIRVAGAVPFDGESLDGQVVDFRVGDQRKTFVADGRRVLRSGDAVVRFGRPRGGRVAFRLSMRHGDVAADVARFAADDTERLRVGITIDGTIHQTDIDLDIRRDGPRRRVADSSLR